MFHMNPEITRELTRIHEQEQRGAADRLRLLRVDRAVIYSPLLVKLGKQMVSWGTTLQTRYTECADVINEFKGGETANPASGVAFARK